MCVAGTARVYHELLQLHKHTHGLCDRFISALLHVFSDTWFSRLTWFRSPAPPTCNRHCRCKDQNHWITSDLQYCRHRTKLETVDASVAITSCFSSWRASSPPRHRQLASCFSWISPPVLHAFSSSTSSAPSLHPALASGPSCSCQLNCSCRSHIGFMLCVCLFLAWHGLSEC